MAKARVKHTAVVGVAEHGNSAVLVTMTPGGDLLDRRRIDLTQGLPTHPYHHEGSWAIGRYVNSPWARAISLPDAVALIERVRESAARGARESLKALAATVSVPIASIAIRVCPPLPVTAEERIADTRAAWRAGGKSLQALPGDRQGVRERSAKSCPIQTRPAPSQLGAGMREHAGNQFGCVAPLGRFAWP